MRFLLIAALAVACAGPALAGFPVPDPSKCSIPDFIILVGHDGVTADPMGAVNVVVRSYQNTIIANSAVTIDFSGCPYVQLCPNQYDLYINDCQKGIVVGLTDITGTARYSVVGSATPAACPSDAAGCAKIYADGVYLGTTSVATLDLDGLPGLSGGDLSTWLGAYFCGSQSPRLDYGGFGVDGGDLYLWLGAFLGSRSAQGCLGAPCH